MAKKNELPELPKSFASKEEKATFVDAIRAEHNKRAEKQLKAWDAHTAAEKLADESDALLKRALSIRVKAPKA